ncbi:3-dehydroquinate synthase [Aggregatimonas sangjinii]|uniref:3-dehydroquinate synthase n=1 Tax=Aggregatimonas sangjinii TaxID=2583587 RepID=A0A5B7SR14_9FLAO|nr:3-dehydroquinate synthase [Aggregatimonas sangjinii]QCW99798.1 3-dehydroquinate synthase [Aggregatimonas sangjinii]
MKSITSAAYSVHFNTFAFAALNTHLEKASYSKVFILVDENSHEHCLPILMPAIEAAYDFEVIEIESGEINKNIATCTRVWEVLSGLDADRKSVLINLGGGVITDLGGFVASTYKRGIDFINIPTTLLAMVDASVGGKTGVDLGALKNQVGVISQPQMVLVVSEFLNTLEERQLQSGFAEMLKHGLIRDRNYWNTLKNGVGADQIDTLIHQSVGIKNEVVLQDPTEQSLRKILNYGHTLGHAVESFFLESAEHELLLHGEAIAIGMVLEGWLSHNLQGLQMDDLTEIKNTFAARYPKIVFSSSDIDGILSLLKFDKKNSHGNINFVLLKGIGNPVIDVQIEENLIRQAFAYYSE